MAVAKRGMCHDGRPVIAIRWYMFTHTCPNPRMCTTEPAGRRPK